METKDLVPLIVTLIAVGILIGIGIVLSQNMGRAGRNNLYIYNDSFAFTNATNVNFDNGNITSFLNIHNASGSVLGAGNYTLNLVVGNATMILYGTLANSTCKTDGATLCYADYYYDEYNTAAGTAMGVLSTELLGLTRNWLSLIVIVFIAALIIGLVMNSFQQRR
jgi:phosphotransferase system  glucose/maltose/N-acetylglucosamine-specific IIC component